MKTIKEASKEYINNSLQTKALSNVNYEENNYEAGYNDSLINNTGEAFNEGAEFAQKWTYIEEELPQYYQIVLADNGEYTTVVARVSDGDEDDYSICGTNVYMSPNPIKWRHIELK